MSVVVALFTLAVGCWAAGEFCSAPGSGGPPHTGRCIRTADAASCETLVVRGASPDGANGRYGCPDTVSSCCLHANNTCTLRGTPARAGFCAELQRCGRMGGTASLDFVGCFGLQAATCCRLPVTSTGPTTGPLPQATSAVFSSGATGAFTSSVPTPPVVPVPTPWTAPMPTPPPSPVPAERSADQTFCGPCRSPCDCSYNALIYLWRNLGGQADLLDCSELQDWHTRLATNRNTTEQFVANLVRTSLLFKADAGANSFIDNAYDILFGRSPNRGGTDYYLSRLDELERSVSPLTARVELIRNILSGDAFGRTPGTEFSLRFGPLACCGGSGPECAASAVVGNLNGTFDLCRDVCEMRPSTVAIITANHVAETTLDAGEMPFFASPVSETSNSQSLVIGVGIAGGLLVLVGVGVAVWQWKRRRLRYQRAVDDDNAGDVEMTEEPDSAAQHHYTVVGVKPAGRSDNTIAFAPPAVAREIDAAAAEQYGGRSDVRQSEYVGLKQVRDSHEGQYAQLRLKEEAEGEEEEEVGEESSTSMSSSSGASSTDS